MISSGIRRQGLWALPVLLMGFPPAAWGDVPGAAAGGVAELDAVVEPFFELGMAPGMAVAVVDGEDLVYARGFGVADVETGEPVRPDTLFYVASTTKSLTAAAAAVLAQRGAIDLDAPIAAALPDLALAPPLSAATITLRDLLTLTHGIADGGPVVFRTAYSGEHSPELLLRLLAAYPPAASGREFAYGNLGYNVAGLVLEALLGASWKEIVEREILAPVGMVDTRASLAGAGARLAAPHEPTADGFRRIRFAKADANLHAAGGHVSTVLDLARWLEVQLNAGRLDGRQVLPAAAIAETQRHQADQDREFGAYHRDGWGLGWDLGTYRGERLVHRFGSFAGFRSHVSFLPEKRLGVAVLVNDGALGAMVADLVANAIYDHRLDGAAAAATRRATLEQAAQRVAMGRRQLADHLAERAARSQDLPHPRAAYTGAFENPDYGVMRWTLDGDALQVAIGLAESTAEVYDAAANQLRVELTGGGEVVTFAFADGRAVSVSYAGREFERTGD